MLPAAGHPKPVGTGWLPPMPDLRDYTPSHPDIAGMVRKLGVAEGSGNLPSSMDLRQWCPPVENQGGIGACTAQAAAGMVEYYERRAFGRHIDCSRLFIYKTTRNLMGVVGDGGAWLRNTMGALALCGAPPEKYWPYSDNDTDYDLEPTAFVYALADNFEALRYCCHDPMGAGMEPATVLGGVKRFLSAGVPSAFGFFGFPSFDEGAAPGDIPMPCADEQAEWGHAVLAVGYDDSREVGNKRCGTASKGALLVRNSWGREWGEDGYGWIPYGYVTQGLAMDFWSLFSMGWIDTGQFGS
nr:C1 family peptidase [Pelodictyon luteolum]